MSDPIENAASFAATAAAEPPLDPPGTRLRSPHGFLVGKNAEVGSVPVDGTSCRFRTTQDVELVPLSIEDVRVDTGAQLTQSLRIELKVTGGTALAAINLSSLRFYIHGERRLQDDVRLWLGAHTDGVALAAVDAGGRDTVVASLPARSIRLVGFQDEEAWIEYRLEHHPEFLRRVAEAREAIRAGRGVRLEDLPA